MKRLVTRHLSFVTAAAVVAMAATTAAARTVSIASTTDSTITLAFGDADGETYTLHMAYGTTDGGTTTLSAWDHSEELGDIDAGDDEYTADFPAGWGATVKALRFFLLGENNSVAAYTDPILANVLVVEAGSPTSIRASAEYDEIRLRDSLRIYGGTVTSATVVVDGPAGNLEIDGGAISSVSRLSLDPALETENEYATLLVLRQGATILHCATNANPDVAARIHFLGGSLKCTSFDGKPFCSANGGKWILEGTPDHPIRFGGLGLQRMDWLIGDGSIETRGYCDVLFDDSNYNAEHDYRGTIRLNTSNTVWNHTGNLVLSNAIDVICTSDNCLPSGPQTGIIEMKWVNRAGPPPPRLNLNGHSVAVRGIDGRSGAVVVTNSSSTVATIRIGEGDATGSITNLVLCKGNINLVKRGSETNFVSLGSSSLAALRVESGTLVVTGTSSDTLGASSVTVADGATLVIVGTAVRATTVESAGTVEYIDGGSLGTAFGGDGADTVIWDDPGLAEGTAFAKIGSNRCIVQTTAALNSDIDVQKGTLVFSGRTCTNEWYRFVFNGMQYQSYYQVAIGDLRVYSDTNKTEDVAQGIGSGGNVLSAGTSPANLAQGQCVASFATTTTKPSGQTSMNLWDLRNAFDNSAYNAVLSASTYYLYNNASQVWVAFRMAAGHNRVQSYLPVKSYVTWYWHPNSWLFQTSPDGVNWQTVDTQKNVLTGDGYGSTPFLIKGFLADGAAGFDPTSNVTVATNATLDASGVAGGQTLSRLTIDMTAGAGTIRGVTIPPNGVINLVNVPQGLALATLPLPVTLRDLTNGRNFTSWTVLVEGQPGRTGVPKWDGETLSLFDGTTLIKIR